MAFQKATKEEANYRADPGNILEPCGKCHFFNFPARCYIVDGRILPEDTCDLFIPQKTLGYTQGRVASDTGRAVIDTPLSIKNNRLR